MSNIDLPIETPPDWNAHPTDVLCPLCTYNLRGLTISRCPECGFAFTWRELLDAEKNRHPYLFEHGKGRNFKTLWKTYWRTYRPRRFWSEINPAQPVSFFRLMVYWLVTAGMVAICMSAPKIINLVRITRENLSYRAAWLNPTGFVSVWTMTTAQANDQWPLPWQLKFWQQAFSYRYDDRDSAGMGWSIALLLWPWITLLVLQIFRMSMRQAKIRSAHLLRTIIYSCDFSLLFAVVFVAHYWVAPVLADGWFFLLAAIIFSAITTYRLTIAFRKYLRVHLPFATVLVSQIIALQIVVLLLLIQIADFSRRV